MRLSGFVSAAVLAAAAMAMSSDASAQRNRGQASSVLVVNIQRVVAESAIGRDMTTKLGQVRQLVMQEAQTSLQPEGASLEQERQRLAQGTRNMSPEQIRNSSTWAPQFQQFQQRVQQFQARQQGLLGDVDCSQLFALRELDRLLAPIIQNIMESRGAGVVLDSTNTLRVTAEFDITTTVIQQMDQNPATRTATVARHGVAECQAQQPAQPQQ